MLGTVEKFLAKYDLINSSKTYLVGFSGGADSLCLLDLLSKICPKYNIILLAVHVNHNWRGEEALLEMKNCEKYCKENNIEFVSTILDENLKKTELVAREERQRFFKECAQKFSEPIIFTGHTATDNAETVVYRLAKGTGVEGLKGILPVQKMNGLDFVRPLLSFSRSDTLGYCENNRLGFNVDSSNQNTEYKRNFIRYKVMPLLKRINPQAEKSINILSKIAQSESNIIQEYLNSIMEKVAKEDKFLTQKFLKLSQDVQQKLIYNQFIDYKLDYDYQKIDNLLNFIKESSNLKSGSRISVTNDLWLFANSKEFYFIENLKSDIKIEDIQIDKEGEYHIDDKTIFSIKKHGKKIDKFPPEDAYCAYVNLDKIDFVLRTRKDGDYITPLGMKGSMKIKKFFNSKGIEQHKKDGILLLTRDSEAFWAIGVGLSDKIKVVQNPTHVLKLYNVVEEN